MKIRREHFLRNTAFGFFVGIELTLLLAFIFSADIRDDVTKFYAYLIAASVSLIAAMLTLVGVFANIENVRTSDAERRKRKLISARAFLPTSLSKVCQICEAGMLYSHNFQEYENNLGEAEFRQQSLRELELSTDVIEVFRNIIELTDDDVLRERLAGIFREHQVHFARWRSGFESDGNIMVRTDSDLRQRTVGWAYIYAIASSLFDFARSESDGVEETEPESLIRSALNSTNENTIFAEDFAEEIGLYERTFQRRFY